MTESSSIRAHAGRPAHAHVAPSEFKGPSLPRQPASGKKPRNIIRAPMTTTTSAAGDALHVLRERGFVQQLSDEAGLQARFRAGPVCFYAGFDPTAASLHVGSLVPLIAMAHLARAG